MTDHLSRRRFISTAGTTTLGALLLPAVSCTALGADSRFTIGLSQYSLRALIQSGELDPLDYPQFTVDQFGIKAVDYWEGGLPKEKLDDFEYLGRLRARAAAAGTDLFLLMTGAVNGAAANLDGNKAVVKAVARAQAMGARYLRVFLWVPDKEEAEAARGAVEALKPLSDHAAEKGVKLVIEPGASTLTQGGEFLARVAEELKHPNCRLMPDFGKLRGDIYAGTQAMMPHTELVSCKMHSFDEAGHQPDFDYPRLMKIIADSGFRGILAIEWEGKKLQPIEGVKASRKLIEQSLQSLG